PPAPVPQSLTSNDDCIHSESSSVTTQETSPSTQAVEDEDEDDFESAPPPKQVELEISSLADLIERYLRAERLDDYRCESCSALGYCECTMELRQLPEVLIVTLN